MPPPPSDTSAASVIRTSLVFWFLSEIALRVDALENGTSSAYIVTPQDCNAAFRELGQCDAGYRGVNVCLDGLCTGCPDEDVVRFVGCTDCEPHVEECIYYPRANSSDWTTCWHEGTRKCAGGACTSSCFDVIWEATPRCEDRSAPGDSCRTAGRGPVAARLTPMMTAGLRCDGAVPNPASGLFAVALALDRPGPLRLEVLDVAGRLRLERCRTALAAGAHTRSSARMRGSPRASISSASRRRSEPPSRVVVMP
jgi:hypothetical protein